jgi:hypothetical protein
MSEHQEEKLRDLAADAALTRRDVVADVAALKSQLSAGALKDRALDVAERSVESLATRLLRRAGQAPRAALGLAIRHPGRALAIGGGLLACVLLARRARS